MSDCPSRRFLGLSGERLGAVREHRFDLMLLRLADVGATAEVALGARALRAEVVAQVRPLPLHATVGRQLEALLGAAVRLHLYLGHGSGAVYRSAAPRQAKRAATGVRRPRPRQTSQPLAGTGTAAAAGRGPGASEGVAGRGAATGAGPPRVGLPGPLAAGATALGGRTSPAFGPMTMTIRRPSMMARCSTVAMSATIFMTVSSIACPVSGWTISRPRNTVTSLHLFPSDRKRRMCFTLKSRSWSSVFGRSLISFSRIVDWCFRDAFSFLDVSYLNLPKSMILHTGGAARGLTSTSSRPCSSASRMAS